MPYIEDIFPVGKIHDEDTITIYQVKDTASQESGFQADQSRLKSGLLISPNSPLAPLYFGEGWGLLSPGRPIAAQRKEVRLLVPLSDKPQQITIRIRLPEGIEAYSRSIFFELNGWQSPSQNIGAEWQELVFDVPGGVTQSGLNDIWLHFGDVTPLLPPEEWILSRTPITPEITVLSAGKEVGDLGHIFVNGYDVSPNQRGYNIAIIQADDTIQTANFDTFLDPAASAALANFIRNAPTDARIAVAVADEASTNLSAEAVLALQSIGAAGDLRGCFRCSQAIIGQPGQASGIAIESLDALRPVGVTTGLGLTEPNVAGIVEWIQVESVEE
jgi:hypothetical protein